MASARCETVSFSTPFGYGAGDLEDAVLSAGRQALPLHGSVEKAFDVGTQLATCTDLPGRCLGALEKTLSLDFLNRSFWRSRAA